MHLTQSGQTGTAGRPQVWSCENAVFQIKTTKNQLPNWQWICPATNEETLPISVTGIIL